MPRKEKKKTPEQLAAENAVLKRQETALDLRISGLSYRAIGSKLSVSHETVRQDVEEELERLASLRVEKTDVLRELELQRLDKIIESLDSWVSSGNVGAVNAWLKASERRAKLLGLDAPVKQDITSNGETIPIIVTGMDTDEL